LSLSIEIFRRSNLSQCHDVNMKIFIFSVDNARLKCILNVFKISSLKIIQNVSEIYIF